MSFRINIKQEAGFSLVELMITLAIIGIIAAIALPSYQNYTRKAYYSEIVTATDPYKLGVVECVSSTGGLGGCNAGFNGVPAGRTTAIGSVASLKVEEGVITVVPVETNGILVTDTYILTPVDSGSGILTWTTSGGAVTKHYAK